MSKDRLRCSYCRKGIPDKPVLTVADESYHTPRRRVCRACYSRWRRSGSFKGSGVLGRLRKPLHLAYMRQLHEKGLSLKEIARELEDKYHYPVTHDLVWRRLKELKARDEQKNGARQK